MATGGGGAISPPDRLTLQTISLPTQPKLVISVGKQSTGFCNPECIESPRYRNMNTRCPTEYKRIYLRSKNYLEMNMATWKINNLTSTTNSTAYLKRCTSFINTFLLCDLCNFHTTRLRSILNSKYVIDHLFRIKKGGMMILNLANLFWRGGHDNVYEMIFFT